MKIAAAANSVESSPTVPEKPEIELEFIGVHFSLLYKVLSSFTNFWFWIIEF